MSNRIQKVNELLKQEVGTLIQRELEMPRGVLTTITRAEAESDLKKAKIFVRIYPEDHTTGALDYLRKNARSIQRILNHRLKMKFVPEIAYYIDKKNEALSGENDVEQLLDSLK